MAGATNQQGGRTVDVRVRETMLIDVPRVDGTVDQVAITLEHKSGQMARLRVQVPEGISVRPPKLTRTQREMPPALGWPVN